MNTAKLLELIDTIQSKEVSANTQSKFENLIGSLQNIASQPQNAQYQNALADSLKALRISFTNFFDGLSPQDHDRINELSDGLLSEKVILKIEASVAENAMSPTVVLDLVTSIYSQRQKTFEHISNLSEGLDFLDFRYSEPNDGMAELGFQIPRELFKNNLDGFIGELRDIKSMIRFVSEATVGQYEAPIIETISTSDPLIFLGVATEVAKHFGVAVTWAIGVWFSVEQIRKVRAETARLTVFTEKEVDDIFGTKIKAQIDQAVDEKVREMLESGRAPKARHGELSGSLKWVLESLLAKIERGMTVELRLPAPIERDVDDDEEVENREGKVPESDELGAIQQQLVFPRPSDNPVLSVPKHVADE